MMEGGDLFNRIHSKKQAAWEGFKAQWRRLIVRTVQTEVPYLYSVKFFALVPGSFCSVND